MYFRFLVWLGFFVTSTIIASSAVAQNLLKQEREERIKFKEMPPEAQDYLREWKDSSRKTRYYYETDGEQASYEAKLQRDKRWFSIEFNKNGQLQDIEELIDFKEIPQTVRFKIDSTFKAEYDKYVIQRIQRQFLLNSTDTYKHMTSENSDNYELEVSLATGSQVQSYEMLFDRNGRLKQQRLIVRRSLDNLLY